MTLTKQVVNKRMINLLALHKQHLLEQSRSNDIIQIVKDIGGLHAQVPTTPYLSLFVRTGHFNREQLNEALYIIKNLARIKSIRRTVYIFTKDMIPAAFASTKRMLDLPTEKYEKQLGITRQEYENIAENIVRIVQGRGLTTKEIKNELGTALNISLVVNLMCDQGILIRGIAKSGWRSNQHTYFLFSEYLPDVDLNGIDEMDAKEKMIEQYLVSFGAVTENDIAWWTGFPKGEIRQILERLKYKITRLEVLDLPEPYIMLSSDAELLLSMRDSEDMNITLLPVLDPYIMGYKDRSRYLDYKNYENVFDFGGNATMVILLDGEIIGIWDLERDDHEVMKILMFKKENDDVWEEINFKAQKIARFIVEQDVQIKRCQYMTSLKQRTAGGYLTPLKGC